ncbi:MAG: hypothetical protein C00003105_00862 [ANME-2 cluster archaeon HR1]|jgi:hypothetical protein|nr:MAG: hypothetical protein C00003105_00862 [ANME-2 cluster archaeon HR1]
MSLIIDNLSISYKFLAPHPFDERLFIKKIEDLFTYKADVLAVNIDESGHVTSKPKPVYITKDGTSELNFNPEIGIIGIKGEEFNEVTSYFDHLKNLLEIEMEVDFNNDIEYLELLSKGRYKGKYQPLEALNKYYSINKSIFNNLFDNEDVINMEIRVCNETNLKTRKNIRKLQDWFDIKVSPFIINPNFYAYDLVYRKSNIEEVKIFWSKLEDKIKNLFIELEREGS